MITTNSPHFWRTVAALGLGAFVAYGNLYVTQPLLPLLSGEFGVSALVAGLSVSLAILALGFSLLLYGPLSDALGRRGIMRLTLGGTVALTLALALAPNFGALLLLRLAQGILIGGLPALALAYLGEEFAPEALTPALGIYIAATSLSGISGRLISGLAAGYGGWRCSFLTTGVVSLLFVLLFFLLLPPSRHFQARDFQWRSAVAGFAAHLRNPLLVPAFLIGGLNFFLFVGQFNTVVYLLVAPPFRLPPALVSLLYLTFLAGTASSVCADRLIRGRSRTFGLALGFGIVLAGILLTLAPHLAAVIGGLLLVSFGFFLVHALATAWVGHHARTDRASASALYLIFYYLAGSLGGLYAAFFWDRFGWGGVVSGAFPILLAVGCCLHCLSRLEKAEAGEVVFPGWLWLRGSEHPRR
ncbi:MAG: MFS transporter [Deltaproteobacteria bacterium]|nr:MFS transporter [Deltaproteobacteria bacterium]